MSVQPIDIGAIQFKLIFHNINREYWIDPPTGWDEMPIEIKRQGIYSRQIQIGEGKELSFEKHKVIELGHQFDTLISVHELYADEAFVEFVLFVDGSELLRAELLMKDSKTDRLNYFSCPLAINDLTKTISDLEDTKVNVYGTESLNGNYNAPVASQNVTLMPKKIRERAKHEIGNEDMELVNTDLIKYFGADNQNVGSSVVIGNPYGLLRTDQSDAAQQYFVPTDQEYTNATPNNQIPTTYTQGSLINTQNLYFETPSEVTLSIENVRIRVEGQNITNQLSRIVFQVALISYNNADLEEVVNKEYVVIKDVPFTKDLIINESVTLNLPRYTRVIYEYRVYVGARISTPDERVIIEPGGAVISDTIDIYPLSFARMTRLINAGKKILSVYSENSANVTAPRFEQDGEFWWYFITSGYFIRGFTGTEFDLNFKDWKEFIQKAFNCDVQIYGNNVFIGKHEDFYEDVEITRIEFKPDEDNFEIDLNPELILNEVNIKYANFESDKKDTIDAFHTESEWYVPKKNKGSLDLDLGFTADGYSIEYARREGIEAEPTTAKQKDDDVYIVDCFINRIHLPFPLSGYVDVLQNRQNQGFEVTPGTIFSPETVYNLRLSLKRLLLDHYGIRLAEIGQKLSILGFSELLKNTFFKSNGDLQTKATDLNLKTYPDRLIEKENVSFEMLKNPIISPEIYNFTIAKRIKYDELIQLYSKIINERGYVTFYTSDSEKKMYIFEASYDWVEEKLTLKAEMKHEI